MAFPTPDNRAVFKIEGNATPVPVCFNPASLEYSITLNAQGAGGQTQQATSQASAKLTMELLFDSSDTGDDVRKQTHKIELLLQPAGGTGSGTANPPTAVPPNVTFSWGAISFSGIVDSFKQTMDFFSAEGVPLRASISLSLSQSNYQFDQADSGKSAGVDGSLSALASGGSPFGLALLGGDPSAARAIATLNGLESLRAEAGGAVGIGGTVTIGAAVGFSASAGAGAGFGLGLGAGATAGAGFGVSAGASARAGFGVSAGAGFGAGASAGFSVGASASAGGQTSAGIGASAGAFSSLRTDRSSDAGRYFDPARIVAGAAASATFPGAVFDVTGRALGQGDSSFKADVGATKTITFDAL